MCEATPDIVGTLRDQTASRLPTYRGSDVVLRNVPSILTISAALLHRRSIKDGLDYQEVTGASARTGIALESGTGTGTGTGTGNGTRTGTGTGTGNGNKNGTGPGTGTAAVTVAEAGTGTWTGSMAMVIACGNSDKNMQKPGEDEGGAGDGEGEGVGEAEGGRQGYYCNSDPIGNRQVCDSDPKSTTAIATATATSTATITTASVTSASASTSEATTNNVTNKNLNLNPSIALAQNIRPRARSRSLPRPKPARPLALSFDPSSPPPLPSPKRLRRNTNASILSATPRKNKHNDGPPLSMITRGYYDTLSPTTSWVAQHSIAYSSPTAIAHNYCNESSPGVGAAAHSKVRPLLKPIRSLKPSSHRNPDMSSRRSSSQDQGSTVRALDLDSICSSLPVNEQTDQDEVNSDDSDLFLRAAREEELAGQSSLSSHSSPTRADSRSRLPQRMSLPIHTMNTTPSRRDESGHERPTSSRRVIGSELIGQALTYHPMAKDKYTALDDIHKRQYHTAASGSAPHTPRVLTSPSRRQSIPDAAIHAQRSSINEMAYGGRRASRQDVTLPPTATYRHSHLSYSAPRNFNSSPLVSRTIDANDAPEVTRVLEDSESTVSTTVHSTVWDELDDLKSRIQRLELTGKIPATSGAAVSRASNDRPATATTTVTTISMSPKRGRTKSISPSAKIPGATSDNHPLLQAALTKSKPLLSPEVYRALESTVTDALTISSMMGSSGQPGPISSSQSIIGRPCHVTDRQVRRKADDVCRSLTELCLALSETRVDTSYQIRTTRRDVAESRPILEPINTQLQLVSTDLSRTKSSPRALSSLEARRSSLLTPSTLPSSRFSPSGSGIPSQNSTAGRRSSLLFRGQRGATQDPEEANEGRRSSLLLRGRRATTQEPEEGNEGRFRTPSRALTEINHLKNSPREYTAQESLPGRVGSTPSSLPVRRHVVSHSLTHNTLNPPVSGFGGRKFLECMSPERDRDRDSNGLLARRGDDRGHRKPSFNHSLSSPLVRNNSLGRRMRQSSSTDYSAGHTVTYD